MRPGYCKEANEALAFIISDIWGMSSLLQESLCLLHAEMTGELPYSCRCSKDAAPTIRTTYSSQIGENSSVAFEYRVSEISAETRELVLAHNPMGKTSWA